MKAGPCLKLGSLHSETEIGIKYLLFGGFTGTIFDGLPYLKDLFFIDLVHFMWAIDEEDFNILRCQSLDSLSIFTDDTLGPDHCKFGSKPL